MQTLSQKAYIAYSGDDDGTVLDVPSASAEPGMQLQAFSYNGTQAQRLYIRHMKDDMFTIQPVCSGLYLTDLKGKVVQQGRMATTAQLWRAFNEDDGFVLTNVYTGRSIAVSDGLVVTVPKDAENRSVFGMEAVGLLPDGCYELCDVASGCYLDVEDGSSLDGANVQLHDGDGTVAQAWLAAEEGNGWYTLINNGSYKALDVEEGSTLVGANVQQSIPDGTDAQLWKPDLRADGTVVFSNKGSDLLLAAVGQSDGDNVLQAAKQDPSVCKWRLTEIEAQTLSGDAELDAYIRDIVYRNGGDLRACFVELTNMKGVAEMDDEIPWGLMDEATTRKYATYVMQRGESDCYGASSVFAYVARACGYPAYLRGGSVSAIAGAEVHGWTEVYVDGTPYVCDVSLGRAYREYDWYMRTYDDAPAEYIF